MFTLIADGNVCICFDTQEDALRYAREINSEAFEIRDETNDAQVYVEWPKVRWL